MKKQYILILIVLIIILLGTILIINSFNNNIIITSDYNSTHYSVKQDTNSITETIYSSKGSNPVKTEIIYTFNGNMLSGKKMVVYYESVSMAKSCEKTEYDNDDEFTTVRDKNKLTIEFKSVESSTIDEILQNIELKNKNNTKI